MFSNDAGKTCGVEERKESKRLGQPPNLSGIEDDRSSSGIDAKVAAVHVGLGEDQRLIDNVDVWDIFGLQLPDHLNSLRERKNKHEQRGPDATDLVEVALQSLDTAIVLRRL